MSGFSNSFHYLILLHPCHLNQIFHSCIQQLHKCLTICLCQKSLSNLSTHLPVRRYPLPNLQWTQIRDFQTRTRNPGLTFRKPRKPGLQKEPVFGNSNLACSMVFHKPDIPRLSWSGYVQTVSTADHRKPAIVEMKPLIDVKSTDNSCLYSTLAYVCEQLQELNVTPRITFDQPLWTIANIYTVSDLDGFYMLMSFLGSIGSMMAGSGLEDVLQHTPSCTFCKAKLTPMLLEDIC